MCYFPWTHDPVRQADMRSIAGFRQTGGYALYRKILSDRWICALSQDSVRQVNLFLIAGFCQTGGYVLYRRILSDRWICALSQDSVRQVNMCSIAGFCQTGEYALYRRILSDKANAFIRYSCCQTFAQPDPASSEAQKQFLKTAGFLPAWEQLHHWYADAFLLTFAVFDERKAF